MCTNFHLLLPFSCCNSDSYFDLLFDELSFGPIFYLWFRDLHHFSDTILNSSLNIKTHSSESFLIGHVIIHFCFSFQNCLCFRFLFVGLFCICFVLILFVSFCSCLLKVQQQQCLVSSPMNENDRYFNSGSLGLFLISLATDTGAQSRRRTKSCSQSVARLRMFSCASRRTLHVSACFWSTLPSGLLVKNEPVWVFCYGKGWR